jgi:anti-sigma B factor antagonist
MEETLTVLVRQRTGYVLVAVAGEIDLSTAPRLRQQLAGLTGGGRVVVDLCRVRFIDAAGLGVLARAAGQAAAHGGSLRVVTARPGIRRLFSISGLERHVHLAWTVAEAAASATTEE